MSASNHTPIVRLLILDNDHDEAELNAEALQQAWEAKYSEKLQTAVFRGVTDGDGNERDVALSQVDSYDGVLLDIVYDEGRPEGIEIARQIRERYQRLPIVVFSRNAEVEHFQGLLEYQVAGFVKKQDHAEVWCPAIREALHRFMGPDLAWPLLQPVLEMSAKGESWRGWQLWHAIWGFARGSNSSERWDNFRRPSIEAGTGFQTSDLYADLTRLFGANELPVLASSPAMRGHLEHVVQVYLLGYLISHRVPGLKDVVWKAVQGFPNEVRDDVSDPDTCWSLFQNAWLLSALLHDVGYAAETLPRMLAICGDTAKEFPVTFDSDVPDSLQAEGWSEDEWKCTEDALKIMGRIGGKHLAALVAKSSMFTDGSVRCHNHGVASASKFLVTVRRTLENPKALAKKSHAYFAKWAAAAMSLHAMRKSFCATTPPIAALRCRNDPLSFLLILCDELQEWNRERFDQQYDANLKLLHRNLMATRLTKIDVVGHRVSAEVQYVHYPHLQRKDIGSFVEELREYRSKRNREIRSFLAAEPIEVAVEFTLLGFGSLDRTLQLT